MAYQLEETPMWLDVQPIIESPNPPVKFEYRGQLHTELDDLIVTRIVSIDTVKDYAGSIGDYIHIEFIMSLGDYTARLYPHRTNLEFSIKSITLNAVGNSKLADVDTVIDRYKAVFMPAENRVISASDLEQYDYESLNLTDTITVKLQLLDRALEPLRIKTVSGVFRQTSQQTLIHSLMSGGSLQVLVDGRPSIDGVDIVPPDNLRLSAHSVIPDGTLITEVPSYIQEHMGGVYASGIGNYLQMYKGRRVWFVYPLYSATRFDGLVDRLIVYAIPQERFPELDRTYRVQGSILSIIANGARSYHDTADSELMNQGSGFRMPDANAFMRKPISLRDDTTTAQRASLNYEVITRKRSDGLNYAPVVKAGGNPFTQYAKIIARDIARVDLEWDYANPRLLYPGMPCKYVYMVKGRLIALKGNIVHVHVYASLEGKGVESRLYRTRCHITLSLQRASYTDASLSPITGGL